MFQSTRLKLTAWYLLILMSVSILFSIFIFTLINQEYNRIERTQRLRLQRMLPQLQMFSGDQINSGQSGITTELQLIPEARERLETLLILVNLFILGVAGVAGYFLAGITLKPIQKMVDEQNRFITDASHELRTPLTSLKTSIEVYLRNKQHNLPESDALLESNLEEVNNLQLLSDGLIQLTQYQKTNGNIIFTQVSTQELIEDAEKKVQSLAKHKNIKIENKIKNLNLEGDKQSLTELLVILLDNAIKYSSKKTTITLSSEMSDHSVIISVRDQGIGISKEDIPHLFDRFYRVDKSRTKTDISGYGLGLSIAKQIVDKHKGSIKVESELGKGTTFYVQIPIKHGSMLH